MIELKTRTEQKLAIAKERREHHRTTAFCEYPRTCGGCHWWSGYIDALEDHLSGQMPRTVKECLTVPNGSQATIKESSMVEAATGGQMPPVSVGSLLLKLHEREMTLANHGAVIERQRDEIGALRQDMQSTQETWSRDDRTMRRLLNAVIEHLAPIVEDWEGRSPQRIGEHPVLKDVRAFLSPRKSENAEPRHGSEPLPPASGSDDE